MERLNRFQSKLLKLINRKNNVPYNELSEKEKSACEYLESKKFIDFTTSTQTQRIDGVFQYWEEIESVSITELGKAHLHNEHVDKYHFSGPDIINILIATIALALSIINLILTLQGRI